MTGRCYLLDTNAIIQVFNGHRSLATILNEADSVATSVICELEFLSYTELTEEDFDEYANFRSCIKVFDLSANDPVVRDNILSARRAGLKLPDAIIAGTAKSCGMTILTADDHFKKLGEDWSVKFYDVE